MIRGSLGVRTSGVSNNTPAFELIAPAKRKIHVREIGISSATTTASSYGIGRPGAIGVTPTSPVRLLSEPYGDPYRLETLTALAWGTPPTAPTSYIRRGSLPAAIGTTIVWTFTADGLVVPAGGSLVIWNLAANGAIDAWVVVDEEGVTPTTTP